MRRRVVLASAVFLLATIVAAVCAPIARAEHEVYYRYVVLGFVKDAQGKPIAGRTVELVRDKTGLSYDTDSDDTGFFVIIARLGDESAGETLTLRTAGVKARVIARFDPKNHVDHRGTRIDIEAGRFVEHPAWFRSTLTKFLATMPPAHH